MSANELDPRAYIPGSLREDKPKTEGQPIHALPMPPYDFQGNTTPTDNLEAGAGDLVERLNADIALTRDCNVCDGDGIKDSGRPCGGCNETGKVLVYRGSHADLLREAAAQLAAATAENARLRERIEQAYKAGFDFAMLTNSADADLAAENARLREALEPFADAVFNDNGDMTVNRAPTYDDFVRAYFAARAALSQEAPK